MVVVVVVVVVVGELVHTVYKAKYIPRLVSSDTHTVQTLRTQHRNGELSTDRNIETRCIGYTSGPGIFNFLIFFQSQNRTSIWDTDTEV